MLIAEKKITVKEFRQMEFEGEDAYYELINGEVVKKSGPTPRHQMVLSSLSFKIMNFVSGHHLGVVLTGPIDVFLDDYNHFLPDLLFISNKNKGIIDLKEGIFGAPDLVMEIISPSSVKVDRINKFREYEKAKVLEYWLVDPNNASIEVYKLEKDGYDLFSFASIEGEVLSEVLKDFEVDLKDIFQPV
jgi:Uma2 family endonuclease